MTVEAAYPLALEEAFRAWDAMMEASGDNRSLALAWAIHQMDLTFQAV